ncbi:protein of unknown function (plasmid) [Cupriavidus taiwanensis]|uniref:Uncharacterized protein n=1 Tax=Cupriavidus taiwanensis TaxID=164546 RepID=A0A7Z7JE80_9BURK|nr:protein of unknown function [Cupriavidus taiwanensis]SOZ12841.1 protein of unknown function [Cupriavidus taiwanensis]SOZ41336.1 protein of unknown function [Cupriavidus taiwanensis]SPC23657.1 protein of unknown function [Cupriavidus taiwanensis]SPD54891.1 protein of unknown function [Cupriavidus taiwanensis]
MSLAIPLAFVARLFAPLSRLRERGGGEGRRVNEVNRMSPRRRAPSPAPPSPGSLHDKR